MKGFIDGINVNTPEGEERLKIRDMKKLDLDMEQPKYCCTQCGHLGGAVIIKPMCFVCDNPVDHIQPRAIIGEYHWWSVRCHGSLGIISISMVMWNEKKAQGKLLKDIFPVCFDDSVSGWRREDIKEGIGCSCPESTAKAAFETIDRIGKALIDSGHTTTDDLENIGHVRVVEALIVESTK